MPTLPLFQVDAFTNRPFTGNPAAICPLESWLPDAQLLDIARENNLSETAFFVREGDLFRLRWFTPTVEVSLCGHATLAAAAVLMRELEPERDVVTFITQSGELNVTRAPDGSAFTLDFPSLPVTPGDLPGLAEALGVPPIATLRREDWVVAVLADASQVRAVRPDMTRLGALPVREVVVTAHGGGADADVDFVSRMFAPALGIPEDPVTGATHCALTPYWAGRIGRTKLRARQVSARSGDLFCELSGSRVRLTGDAVLVLRGTLFF